jgi:2C-methyl-D-erythritol 2,4-cyclodiphosphate synthase
VEGGGARLRAGGGMDHRLRHGVGAPVIAISYALNKLLTGIARQHQMKESLTEEDMAGHALSDAERTALRAGDIGKLYELGANPYLIRRVFRRRFTI